MSYGNPFQVSQARPPSPSLQDWDTLCSRAELAQNDHNLYGAIGKINEQSQVPPQFQARIQAIIKRANDAIRPDLERLNQLNTYADQETGVGGLESIIRAVKDLHLSSKLEYLGASERLQSAPELLIKKCEAKKAAALQRQTTQLPPSPFTQTASPAFPHSAPQVPPQTFPVTNSAAGQDPQQWLAAQFQNIQQQNTQDINAWAQSMQPTLPPPLKQIDTSAIGRYLNQLNNYRDKTDFAWARSIQKLWDDINEKAKELTVVTPSSSTEQPFLQQILVTAKNEWISARMNATTEGCEELAQAALEHFKTLTLCLGKNDYTACLKETTRMLNSLTTPAVVAPVPTQAPVQTPQLPPAPVLVPQNTSSAPAIDLARKAELIQRFGPDWHISPPDATEIRTLWEELSGVWMKAYYHSDTNPVEQEISKQLLNLYSGIKLRSSTAVAKECETLGKEYLQFLKELLVEQNAGFNSFYNGAFTLVKGLWTQSQTNLNNLKSMHQMEKRQQPQTVADLSSLFDFSDTRPMNENAYPAYPDGNLNFKLAWDNGLRDKWNAHQAELSYAYKGKIASEVGAVFEVVSCLVERYDLIRKIMKEGAGT